MRYKKSVFRSLAMVTQLGFSVITPIFLCIFAGYTIDRHFGTRSMIFLLILGTLAGGRCAYVLAMKTLEAEKREDEAERLKQLEQRESSNMHKPKKASRISRNVEAADTGKDMEDSDGLDN